MWWRRLLVLALGGVLLSLASCQAADPGQMDLVFRWPDGAPTWSAEAPYSLWGRIERWPGGEPPGAVLVGEATGPSGKTYAVLGESAEGLTFAEVPYGDGLVVVIAVRQGPVDTTPSEGDELLYYGHSNPFSLEPGDKVTVEVDLELQPAPGAGTEGDDGVVGGGAVWICPADTTTTDPEADCAITHTNSAYVHLNSPDVKVYVRAPNATSLVVANDLSLSTARRVVDLEDLEQVSQVSPDVFALTTIWNLNEGLGPEDGTRSVYAQLENAVGLQSSTYGRTVVLDRTPPAVFGTTSSVQGPPGAPITGWTRVGAGYGFTFTGLCTETPSPETPLRVWATPEDGPGPDIDLSVTWEGDTSFAAFYTVPTGDDAPPDGPYVVHTLLMDQAGNTAEESHLELSPTLYIDTKAPEPPNVSEPGFVTYHRYPWGTETESAKSSTVEALAGSLEPLSRLLIYDGPDPDDAQLLNKGSMVQSEADNEGAAQVNLTTGDRPQVYAQSQDAAGNRSGSSDDTPAGLAVPVRDISWTATMGGKVAGSDLANPHQLVEASNGSATLVQTVGTEAEEPAESLSTGGLSLWRDRIHGEPVPSARSKHVMAYDAARGVSVLFGGYNDGGLGIGLAGVYLHDTWEWNAETWVERTPEGPVPSARSWHAMSYDASRGVTVLFGGYNDTFNDDMFDDTWEWDGETWVERAPDGPVPSARSSPAMVYDASRGVTVLFGGVGSGGYLQDTWEWDGETWVERTPDGPVPSGRQGHRMAYDASRGVAVLFGGLGDGGKLQDTWEWDGETWVERTPDGSLPPPRGNHAMAYDAARGATVLFGGDGTYDGDWVHHQDTWEWDGETWVERAPDGPVPSARSSPAMVYDASRGVTVLFGGVGGGIYLDHTWGWDGETWVERTLDGPVPPARSSHAMVYDASRGVTVLFGGMGSEVDSGGTNITLFDTWEWDGETWVERTPDGPVPSGRQGHCMAYDAARGVTVLFGGADDQGGTWEWGGETWVERTPDGPVPSARSWHAMSYDAVRGVMVLFGGYGGGKLQDTWEWDGETWVERTPDGPVPSARSSHAMAYDASRGVTVLFGGYGDGLQVLQDTWEWDGEAWVEATPDGPVPSVRSSHAMAYDAARGVTVLFGGFGDGNLQDTWEWDGEAWVEATPDGPVPSARSSHAMAYDAARGVTVLFGGYGDGGMPQDTWELNLALTGRPGHRWTASWSHALAPDVAIISGVDVAWVGGGLGHEGGGDCLPIHGAELQAWTGLGWTTLDTADAGPESPEALTWSTTDPDEIRHLFFGLPGQETLNFAVTPTAPNGCGTEYGQIVTDYVEMTVGYRLPGE